MPDSKLFRDTRRSFCLAARWIVHYRHCTIDGALRLRSTAYDDGWVQRVGWRITLMAHHVDGVSPWTVQRVGRCSAFDGAARSTVQRVGRCMTMGGAALQRCKTVPDSPPALAAEVLCPRKELKPTHRHYQRRYTMRICPQPGPLPTLDANQGLAAAGFQ